MNSTIKQYQGNHTALNQQSGDDNDSSIDQGGSGTTANVIQSGDRGRSTVFIFGNNDGVYVEQLGQDNISAVGQNGTSNGTAIVYQSGAANNSNVQQGEQSYANVRQEGVGRQVGRKPAVRRHRQRHADGCG